MRDGAQILGGFGEFPGAPLRVAEVEAIEHVVRAVGQRSAKTIQSLLVLALRQQGSAGVVHCFGAGGQLDQPLEGGRRLVGVSGLVSGEAEIEEALDVNRVVLAKSLEQLRG